MTVPTRFGGSPGSARTRARLVLFALLMLSAAVATPRAQFGYGRRRREPRSYTNPNTAQALKQWFPSAASFSGPDGQPPHVTALGAPPRAGAPPQVLGYAFWTTDLVPNEVGYHGPIKMLVGLTPTGRLTGIVVDSDTEPYGYFSVETPEFARQFAGKSVLDKYRVGDDVDAVSRASISVSSATRAIRDSVHLMARALLNPSDVK
ncbi:MAG: FMN-binding protein [Vicinamibacterales bacterium]